MVTQLENGWTSVITTLALDFLGAVESPVEVHLPASEVVRRRCLLDTRHTLHGGNWEFASVPEMGCDLGSFAEGVKKGFGRNDRKTASNAPLWILWTSGTTRAARGVVLSRAAIYANARGKLERVPQEITDRRLTVLPLTHAYARTCDLATWLLSGCVFSAGNGWKAIEELAVPYRPTMINAVPSLIDRVLAGAVSDSCGASGKRSLGRKHLEAMGLGELRVLGCGGAALQVHQFESLQELGIIPVQGYGLTEAGPVICSASTTDSQAGSVGRPIAGTDLRIAANGELQSHGPGQMSEYWREPEATDARFTEDGWLRTGDQGVIDANGQVRILGRLDEVLVLPTGKKLHPVEYERQLVLIPQIRHCVLWVVKGEIEAIVDTDIPAGKLSCLWEAIEQVEKHWGGWPRIARILRYPEKMSVAGGELTVKGTVKRKVIQARLLAILDDENEMADNEKKGRYSSEYRPSR